MTIDNSKTTGWAEFTHYKAFESTLLKIVNYLASFYTPLHLAFLSKYGVVKDQWVTNNLTMNAAHAVFSGLAGGTGSQTAFTYLALGTSSTAVAASQTALGAEITDSGLQRVAATMSRETTTQTNDTLVFTKTFTASGSKTIEEVGYFNASSSGVMGGRALTSTKSIVSGETITAVYKVKFS